MVTDITIPVIIGQGLFHRLGARPPNQSGETAGMANRIKQLRDAAGMTLEQLAEKAGTSAQQVHRLETGIRRLTAEWMARLSEPLGVAAADLLPDGTGRPSRPEPPPAPFRTEMPRDVPVMGTAEGSNDEGAFHLNLLGGPVDFVRRPGGIAANRGVFAIYVEGESMVPRFAPGELVYVDDNRPPAPGDDVVVVLRGAEPGDPATAWLKRLRRRSPSFVEVEQFNPAKDFRFDTKRIEKMYRVLTIMDLFGL